MQPPWPEPRTGDLRACRALLRSGSRSFSLAARFLSRRFRDPAIALYAFCRLADDAIDRDNGGLEALSWLHERVERAYAGRPHNHFADRALADVLVRFAIPPALPHALLEGLQWDAEGRQYDTLNELTSYAIRVAGSVGIMMALIMGQRHAETLARACDLGVAMQLTNIARDVGEDARVGRLYLPRDWMRETGIAPDRFLDLPVYSPAFAKVVSRLLTEADELYRRADAGISQLPWSCVPGVRAARLLYAGIGQEITRNAYDSLNERAVIPNTRKARILVFKSFARTAGMVPEVPLRDALPLLDAVAATALPQPFWPRSLREQGVFLFELLQRLAQQERLAGPGSV